jgi:Cdc6-like AAA superfamily ATPase
MEGSKIIARESYFEDILDKLLAKNKEPVSLYLCGKPGTGKTFTVEKVIKEIRRRKAYNRKFSKIVEINGMQVTKTPDIWKVLHKALNLQVSRSLQNDVLEFFAEIRKPLVVVIDEFENLITRCNKEMITEIFALPFNYKNVYLIGISNLVDLPDIFLPQLEKRGCVPEIKIFPPYTKSEILEIIQQIYGDQSDGVALEVCATQVEKIGDARRALGICKNSIDNGKISLLSTIKSTTNWHTSFKILTELPYMNKGAVMICKKLSEHHLTTTQMHSAYKKVCSKEGGEGLPLKEFVDMIDNLAAAGIVKLEGHAKTTLKLYPKVVVAVDELEKAFKDLPEVLELASLPLPSSWKFNI